MSFIQGWWKMSKEKNFELSIVKMAKDINYEKPNHPNNLVDKEEYKKIDMAIATSVALTNAGTTLVSENALPELLSEAKKDTRLKVGKWIRGAKHEA